jgi:hypothetical protein
MLVTSTPGPGNVAQLMLETPIRPHVDCSGGQEVQAMASDPSSDPTDIGWVCRECDDIGGRTWLQACARCAQLFCSTCVLYELEDTSVEITECQECMKLKLEPKEE